MEASNDYSYVEVGTQKNGFWQRNIYIHVDEIAQKAKDAEDKEFYVSAFRYQKPEKPSEDSPVLGDFYMDFDYDKDKKDLNEPLEDIKKICEIFTEEFGIEPGMLRIYFTGMKGFRLIIPYQCFGAEPSNVLDKVYKRIAEGFSEAGFRTVDSQIYQKNRLMRLPNTIHGSTGLFMIPLSHWELCNSTINKIKDAAKKAREISYAEPKLCEKARELYLVNKERIGKPIQLKGAVSESFDASALRLACPAVNAIYNQLARGEQLSHNQNIFISKVLIPYGEKGEEEIHRILQLSEQEDYDRNYTQYQINYSKDGKCPPSCDYVRKEWKLCGECTCNNDPINRTKVNNEVIKTIDLGTVKYELLDPKHAQELIFSYHLCEDFALQPVFYPAIVKREVGGKAKRYVEEEKICPFVLFSDSNGKREMYPIDNVICGNGRRYKIKAEPEMLPTMPSAEMTQDFLKGKIVDGKKLWQDVKNYILIYEDFADTKTYVYYTAFLIATYFYYAYSAFPYNHFHGEHNSGKSQAQRIGFRLAYHGEYVKKITSSQIFRTIETTGCSFFIEEAEHLWSRDAEPELQQVLNAGYQKDGVARITDKNTLKSLRFNVYGPKSFSSIREIHPTLRTRTVQNLMLRTLTNKGDISFDDELARKIRDELYILRLQEGTYFAKTAKNSNRFEDLKLSNRDRELFIPLLQVTEKYASEEELEQLKQYIKEKIEEEKTEYIDSDSAFVYRVVKEMLGEEPQKWLLVTDVRTEVIKTDPHAYRSKVIDVEGHEVEEFRILESSATARRFTTQRVGYIMKNMGFKKKRYRKRGMERLVTDKKLSDLESRYIEYTDGEDKNG